MPRDSYSTAEAAKVLGLSERRVRQLISEGKLAAKRDSEGNLRLGQETVHAERRRRRGGGKTTGRKAAAAPAASALALDAEALAETVAVTVTRAIEGQLQITQKAESLLRQELDEERAKRRQAEEQLAEAQARLNQVASASASSGKKRSFFRRREA